MEALSTKINGLSTIKQSTQVMQCNLCGRRHANQEYLAIKTMVMSTEHDDYIGSAP